METDYTSLTRKDLVGTLMERGFSYESIRASWTKTELIRQIQGIDKRLALKKAAEEKEAAHRATREEKLLRQEDELDIECLRYPFGYIGSEYRFEDMYKEVLGYPCDEEKVYGFPQNIKEYYWIRPGENDEDAWLVLGRLKSGLFFFYKAWCDYTGFDCQGGMDLYACEDWKGLIKMTMSTSDYDTYREDCTVDMTSVLE